MNPEILEVARKYPQFVVDLKDFVIESTIGRGGFGTVFYGIHRKSGRKCAIKELMLTTLEGKQLEFFIREIQILSKLDFPFLVPFVGFTTTFPFSILTEYIPNGSLSSVLHQSNSLTPCTLR